MFKLCRPRRSIANFLKVSRQNVQNSPCVRKISRQNIDKLKKLWKRYWKIVLPVHLTLSVFIFSTIYILFKEKADFKLILSYMPYCESYVDIVNASNATRIALSLMMFKLLSPLRYMATIVVTIRFVRYFKYYGKLK